MKTIRELYDGGRGAFLEKIAGATLTTRRRWMQLVMLGPRARPRLTQDAINGLWQMAPEVAGPSVLTEGADT